MFERRSSSIWKLSGMTLGIVSVAMAIMWFFASLALRHSFDEIGRAIIEDDLGEYSVVYEEGGVEAVRSLFGAGGHDGHDQILRLVSSSGNIELNLLLPDQPDVDWPEIADESPMGGEIQWMRHPLGGERELTIGRRRISGEAELWFGRTNAADLDAIAQIHHLILIAMAITTILCAGPIVWFGSRVLRPVHLLIRSAKGLATGSSLGERLKISTSIPELHEFAESFNDSLDRIQQLSEELEAANDQLAHELRTPLARIRGNVERILAESKSDSATTENAAKVISEIDRATGLIQGILSIRAGDSGAMRLSLEKVEVCEVVRNLHELYTAAAEESHLQFSCVLPDEKIFIQIDIQRIQQAVCNLLDNAFAYTPEGGDVEVGVRKGLDSIEVFVKDSGLGIREQDEERVWRRFMRGTNASAEVPGIGLGLSLVKAVAAAHHGSAGLNKIPKGAEFWIRLPIGRLDER